MPTYLSQEWFDEALRRGGELDEQPGASCRLQFHLTGGPDGDVRYFWHIRNGRLTEAGPGEIKQPEATLTLAYEDAVEIERGEITLGRAVTSQQAGFEGSMTIFRSAADAFAAIAGALRETTTYA
jgi:alkyl sulfatase BDS1-like metallo-beta-lactamase superfamily hydrolase